MIEPHVHLAYAPRGAGLLCALFWFAQDDHVYGWFTGARAHEFPASFLHARTLLLDPPDEVLPLRAGRCLRRLAGRHEGESRIDPPIPVPDLLCHQLERLQDAFVREWLVYEHDREREQEFEALRSSGYPVLAVNIRVSKLRKLVTGAPIYTYGKPGADIRLVEFLAQRWPLDYTPD